MPSQPPAKRGLKATLLISGLTASAILAVIIQAYAGATLRGVYADGAFFATQLAAQQVFLQPARVVSNLITVGPVIAAMRLGVQTPHSVALAFSLATNLLPGLIMLLCLPVLPAGQRHFFIFPAFVYFAGTLSAQFASVTEGLVATSYFWLLLYLIAFGRLTILRLAFVVLLAVGTLRLHEQMLLLGPLLVVSCAMRWRNEQHLLPRIVLSVAAVASLASAAIAAHYVLHPFNVQQRANIISALLSLQWLYHPEDGYNLPSVLTILAMPCIFLTMVRPTWGLATTWFFGAVSIPLAFAAFWLDWLISPYAQFAARDNGALISVPLAALVVYAQLHAPLANAITRKPTRGIVILLGLTVSLWHVAATEQWSAFLRQFSNVLQSGSGIIPWDIVVAPSESRQAKLAAKMVWLWTNPDLSLVALSRSCITSVIANPTNVRWQPYTLTNLATMPAIPGISYTYLLPPDQQREACPAV